MSVAHSALPKLRYRVYIEYSTIRLDVPRSDPRSRWELCVTDSGWSLGLAAVPRHVAVTIDDGPADSLQDAVSKGLTALRGLGVYFDPTTDAALEVLGISFEARADAAG